MHFRSGQEVIVLDNVTKGAVLELSDSAFPGWHMTPEALPDAAASGDGDAIM